MSTSNTSPSSANPSPAGQSLSSASRILILVTAFTGWFCAGFLLSATSVALQPAAIDLLTSAGELNLVRYNDLTARSKLKPGSETVPPRPLLEKDKADLLDANVLIGEWVAWLKCSFLFGAAFGGLCFGAIGDRLGRTKGMGLAILTYSLMALLASFSRLPVQLLVCWFFACMGVGGMWPNGVALVAEAWSSLSRTASAGIIGAAANMGIYFMSTIMMAFPPVPSSLGAPASKVFQSLPNLPAMFLPGKVTPTPTDWQWVMLFAALPAVLGVFSLVAVPESPLWLANRGKAQTSNKTIAGPGEIFRPPYLAITLIGIILATIPLIGGWGSADWIVQWADRVGDVNPSLKADVNRTRAFTGIAGALAGGWLASVLGRKLTYFLSSFGSLLFAQYLFWFVVPTDPYFLWYVSGLGLFIGVYFGWLPFCLPEMFPTRARAAGSGVSFNFGRILTAVTVFATGTLMSFFQGDYAHIGRATSLVFAIGMIVIWFAPDTSQKQLEE